MYTFQFQPLYYFPNYSPKNFGDDAAFLAVFSNGGFQIDSSIDLFTYFSILDNIAESVKKKEHPFYWGLKTKET